MLARMVLEDDIYGRHYSRKFAFEPKTDVLGPLQKNIEAPMLESALRSYSVHAWGCFWSTAAE
jgi:hypothetical protein